MKSKLGLYTLLLCDAMLARSMLSTCVRPSVRLSQAGTVPKWLNAGSRKQCRMIAKVLAELPMGSPPTGRQIKVG